MAASEHPAGALRAAVSVHAPRPGFWQRLVEPAASIEEVGARRLARLLSSLLLMLNALGIAATIMGLWARPEGAVWGGVSIVFLAIAYGLSRTRHYPRAALLAVGTLALGALASTYSTVLLAENKGPMAVASWTLLAVILASLYFSVRALLALLLGLLMGLLLLFLAVPAVTAGAFVETAWFLLMASGLIILVTYHQRGVEQDRLAASERHREELVRLNRSMETMLYVISHDLKEPLRAIQSFSSIVGSRYASKLDDKGQDYLQRVSRGADRMRVLLDDILKLSRAQRIEPPATLADGEVIVRAAIDRLDGRIAESGAIIEVAGALPAFRVDKTWATVAVYNLVDNALKHTVDGEPPRVEIAPYDGPRGMGLVVKDRGPGVPSQYTEKIFQLFQRGVGREVPGTGAGLAIVKQIAERHGGSAWVEPREGGGSAFFVTFGFRAIQSRA